MSTPLECCSSCDTPTTVNTPGTSGTNGKNAYTTTTANLVVPADRTTPVTGNFTSTAWMVAGQTVIIGDGGGHALFTVNGTPASATQASLLWQKASGDVAAGATLLSGVSVAPGGKSPQVTVTAITDNSTGTAGDTFTAGVGVHIIPVYLQLAQVTATTLYTVTPGYRFKVLSTSFSAEVAVTTAAKAATITPVINGVTVTGGAVALTSANCTPKGTSVAGSAVTAGNVGTNAQTLALLASGVTAFSEGTGWYLIRVQNLDSADAFASIATKLNSVLTALA